MILFLNLNAENKNPMLLKAAHPTGGYYGGRGWCLVFKRHTPLQTTSLYIIICPKPQLCPQESNHPPEPNLSLFNSSANGTNHTESVFNNSVYKIV